MAGKNSCCAKITMFSHRAAGVSVCVGVYLCRERERERERGERRGEIKGQDGEGGQGQAGGLVIFAC